MKSNLLTLEPCNIVGWDILMSIDAWAQVAIFTHFNCIWTMCGHCNCWDRFCTLGRAHRTKETLPDFYE